MALRLPRFLRSRAARGPRLSTGYAPRRNGLPDPGEVCWAWVPYEEDPSQGKDRPVLVIAMSGTQVVALPLTSKDHVRDGVQDGHGGRVWMDVGTGEWDRERRPSEVRLDRVLLLDASAVRREGAALPRPVFDAVVVAATQYLPEVPGGA